MSPARPRSSSMGTGEEKTFKNMHYVDDELNTDEVIKRDFFGKYPKYYLCASKE